MRYNALIIDAMNCAHRAAAVMNSSLSTEVDGIEMPIGMQYGVIKMSCILYDKWAAPGAPFIVAHEGNRGEIDHRRSVYELYKAHRGHPDTTFSAQFRHLTEILKDLGWIQAVSEGWEADDVAATVAKRLSDDGMTVGIVTGDHDLHQCVTDRVHVIDHRNPDPWDPERVREKWLTEPEKIPYVKAIAGDKSDGYPGIAGFGPKIGTKIVNYYGIDFLDKILSKNGPQTHLRPKPPITQNQYNRIKDMRDHIERFIYIAQTRDDIDLKFLERRYDPDQVLRMFGELRFVSLLAPSYQRILAKMAGG